MIIGSKAMDINQIKYIIMITLRVNSSTVFTVEPSAGQTTIVDGLSIASEMAFSNFVCCIGKLDLTGLKSAGVN